MLLLSTPLPAAAAGSDHWLTGEGALRALSGVKVKANTRVEIEIEISFGWFAVRG